MAHTTIQRGTLVRYTSEFLQSVGWTADVPINGMVTSMRNGSLCRVWWCDAQPDETVGVLLANLEIDRKGESQISDGMRAVLLDEHARAGIEFATN